MQYFFRENCLFFRIMSRFSHMRRVFDNAFHICLDIMHLTFENLISFADLAKIRLEDDIHRVEKKRDIENSISHREDLPCYRMWYQVPESDRRRRDHSEVKCIKIWPSLSRLKPMNQKSPDKPTHDEYESDDEELAVVDMEHMRKENTPLIIRKSAIMQNGCHKNPPEWVGWVVASNLDYNILLNIIIFHEDLNHPMIMMLLRYQHFLDLKV